MVGLVVTAMLVFPVVALAAGGPPTGRGQGSVNQGSGYGSGLLPAGGELTEAQETALVDFWVDEHKALATYEAVMAEFGEVQPFASIANAEQSHIAALENVFARYGVTIPEVPAFDAPTFEVLEDVCAAAAQVEIDNAALYDGLTSLFTQPDVLRVIENLSSASLNSHLPAFEACASGNYEPGTGLYNGERAWGQSEDMRSMAQGQGSPAGTRGRGNVNAPRGSAGQGLYPDCPLGQ